MYVLEITVREPVPALRVLVLALVDAEIPSAILLETVEPNEFVLRRRGRLMLAPCIPLVEDDVSFADQLLRMIERPLIEFDGHGGGPFSRRSWRPDSALSSYGQSARIGVGKMCLTSSISPSLTRIASTLNTARAHGSASIASTFLSSCSIRARNCSRCRSLSGL